MTTNFHKTSLWLLFITLSVILIQLFFGSVITFDSVLITSDSVIAGKKWHERLKKKCLHQFPRVKILMTKRGIARDLSSIFIAAISSHILTGDHVMGKLGIQRALRWGKIFQKPPINGHTNFPLINDHVSDREPSGAYIMARTGPNLPNSHHTPVFFLAHIFLPKTPIANHGVTRNQPSDFQCGYHETQIIL